MTVEVRGGRSDERRGGRERITIVHGGSDHLVPEDPEQTDALLRRLGVRRGVPAHREHARAPQERDRLLRPTAGPRRRSPSLAARDRGPDRVGAGALERPRTRKGWSSPERSPTPSSPASTAGPGPSPTCR